MFYGNSSAPAPLFLFEKLACHAGIQKHLFRGDEPRFETRRSASIGKVCFVGDVEMGTGEAIDPLLPARFFPRIALICHRRRKINMGGLKSQGNCLILPKNSD